MFALGYALQLLMGSLQPPSRNSAPTETSDTVDGASPGPESLRVTHPAAGGETSGVTAVDPSG
jgi:hypothetical protein